MIAEITYECHREEEKDMRGEPSASKYLLRKITKYPLLNAGTTIDVVAEFESPAEFLLFKHFLNSCVSTKVSNNNQFDR